jgi:hypothetical protein
MFRPLEPRLAWLRVAARSKRRQRRHEFVADPERYQGAEDCRATGGTDRLPVMESPARQIIQTPAPDGRQSETALAIARGTARLLHSLGFACVSELSLPSGRRADLVAINERGDIWIVEIKSSLEDLRADQKWPDYRAHCDRLFFAFTQAMPCEVFPGETGLIIADAYGAHLERPAPEHRLPAPTRKAMTVRFALTAALRINRLIDPQGHAEP